MGTQLGEWSQQGEDRKGICSTARNWPRDSYTSLGLAGLDKGKSWRSKLQYRECRRLALCKEDAGFLWIRP